MEEENPPGFGKKNPKRIWQVLTIILAILLIASLAGGGYGYYYLNNRQKREKAALQNEIDALNKKLKEKSDEIEELQAAQNTASKTPETCASTLTPSNEETIKDWKLLNNSKYKYSFKYPGDWTISINESDRVVLLDADTEITFEFVSAEMSIRGYEEYSTISQKNIKVACQDAQRTYLSESLAGSETNKTNIVLALFTKDGTQHLIAISFKYLGASISSDVIETYDLILKTIEFK